ncbi:hypothetical protein [Photobacterium nomapromontoriensis]|uniref:hypothetical protein n=1 Tax=Photobacterium nomapromontoriensis TaxID=2910237 RepID=UPI003D1512CB
MLLLFITLLLTMQVTVKADDIEVQRIDTMDGQTLYAWDDVDQHIPKPHVAKHENRE